MADSVSATNPALSADGRLLAYVANENGRSEVYVRPLDGSLLRKASLAGGTGPRWGHDGVTLFFRNADTLYSAKVRWGNDLVVSDVAPVMSGFPTTGYAVLPGDTAFVTRGTSTITSVPLHVVVNASRELERLFAKQ